jgi:pseudouridine-5'-phosphate glycosidase
VVGYRCERLPFLLVRETDIRLEHLAVSPKEVGAISRTRRDLGVASALLVCNPVPGEHAMDAAVVQDAVQGCIHQAEAEEVKGKEVTPFLLSCLAQKTGGASLEANLALLESNAALAADIAVALIA